MSAIPQQLMDHKQDIQAFVDGTIGLIVERLRERIDQNNRRQYADDGVGYSLALLIESLPGDYAIDPAAVAQRFAHEELPQIIDACQADAERYPTEDPALEDLNEVFYASNGFWATVAYRIANALHRLSVPILPRTVSGIAHSRTGVDIHPGATIAPGLFIDHGTGIAIGCTAVLEEGVNLYNGVVLGTRSKPKKSTDPDTHCVAKRHPTIRRGVSLYTSAFVGGDIEIGEGSVVGAYAFICRNVPPNSVVLGKDDRDTKVISKHQPKRTTAMPSAAKSTANATPVVTDSVIDLIGNTPMFEITKIGDNPNVRIFAKLEGWNASGSIKDRLALSLIEEGEKSGALTKDKVILESTSGNTGIGLAMVGAAKGYEVVLTMSSAMSEERKQVLRAFGATLIETAGDKGTGGAIEHARNMVAENPGKYWVANQHASLDNPKIHYERTAEEILEQVPDVTHFVAGIGTFGTLRGAGVRLREAVGAKVVGLEPVFGKPIQGLRNMNEPFSPELYDESLLDEKINVLPQHAIEMTRELVKKEGLFIGMSSGAAMWGALEVAKKLDSGTIVVIFPDRGEKYLSTPLFEEPQAEPQAEAPTQPVDYGRRPTKQSPLTTPVDMAALSYSI